MGISGGWTPLAGPKVPAKATRPRALTFPTRGILPGPPIPATKDDGFTEETCCAPGAGCGCGNGGCTGALAVNVASGSLLFSYEIPENRIPIRLTYESNQAGVAPLGTYGWTSNLHRSIQKSGNTVTVKCSDGCTIDYHLSAVAPRTFYPTAGIDNLVEQDSVNTNLYIETLPSGLQFLYDLSNSGRLTNLKDPDGRLWTAGYAAGG